MFDLASYLPYLINRAGARLADAFGTEIEAHEITLPMWRVMAALHHKTGQRVGELAEMTSIEVSTLSRLLGSMERKELARRRRSREDARTVLVDLTERGARLTGEIIPRALHYQAMALKDFSPAEIETLRALLIRIFNNIDILAERTPHLERRRA